MEFLEVTWKVVAIDEGMTARAETHQHAVGVIESTMNSISPYLIDESIEILWRLKHVVGLVHVDAGIDNDENIFALISLWCSNRSSGWIYLRRGEGLAFLTHVVHFVHGTHGVLGRLAVILNEGRL